MLTLLAVLFILPPVHVKLSVNVATLPVPTVPSLLYIFIGLNTPANSIADIA